MSGAPRPSRAMAIGIALFVTVLWSSSWVLIRWGLDDEGHPPLTFAALRYGMAGVGSAVLIVAGLVIEGIPSISGKAWAIIGWLALANTALAFTLWNLSLQRLSAVESASINNTMLIQIAFLAWFFLAEALGTAELIGIALVTVGILLTQRATASPSGPPTSARCGSRADSPHIGIACEEPTTLREETRRHAGPRSASQRQLWESVAAANRRPYD